MLRCINTFVIALSLVLAACVMEETPEQTWKGEELWDRETIPDETPAYAEDEPVVKVLGWTPWYDRDDPSGTGDWELRSLQSGVCDAPTSVQCQTVTGLALWQTGEVVSCSASDGLLCRNSDQPDGWCNHDYRVRFYCPYCGDGVCNGSETSSSCPGDCGGYCGDGYCSGNETPTSCAADCCGYNPYGQRPGTYYCPIE